MSDTGDATYALQYFYGMNVNSTIPEGFTEEKNKCIIYKYGLCF